MVEGETMCNGSPSFFAASVGRNNPNLRPEYLLEGSNYEN